MANGIWSTEREPTPRRRAGARLRPGQGRRQGHWVERATMQPLSHGRDYSEDEIWDNYAYFIRQVAPVAEEAGVRIGIHPDDPPVPELGGVPRCIFSSFEGYQRALEIADSPNVGMCLCVGCWLEGGELMGKDVVETIRYFGERKKLFKVHFRNVDQPLPHFVETFLDDGYMDMYKVMKALREVDFDGVLIADHIPMMANDRRVGTRLQHRLHEGAARARQRRGRERRLVPARANHRWTPVNREFRFLFLGVQRWLIEEAP